MIRALDPESDLPAVSTLFDAAADYWVLANRVPHDEATVSAFFTDSPPGCDPALSLRIGLFAGPDLVGVAEMAFGFPQPGDAYLGLMILGQKSRSRGLGALFLADLETRARVQGASRIHIAVLAENPRGMSFWQRQGFADTGFSREDIETGHVLHRLAKAL